MRRPQNHALNLAGPCGFYCGTCRHYLARAKDRLQEKHLKYGCQGCRVQDKNCAWVKRDCTLLRSNQIDFCFECPDFPCANLLKFDERHQRDDQISPILNLLHIQASGPQQWLAEQAVEWRCPACGGALCIMDRECYDCGASMP